LNPLPGFFTQKSSSVTGEKQFKLFVLMEKSARKH